MQREYDNVWAAIAGHIDRQAGHEQPLRPLGQVSGGDIHRAFSVASGSTRYFVKMNDASCLEMFRGEALGLAEIAMAGALRTPAVVASGRWRDTAFLVLEQLDLVSHGAADRLGEGLARVHRHRARQHGWRRDNHIGLTPQANAWADDWVEFWRERRLRRQLELAQQRGHGGRLQERGALLLGELPGFFRGYRPEPSLLHGDLWGGNYAYLADGTPVLFDPAVYYGDRESDLAMTELFGGFSEAFYAAYRAAWPLDPGYPTRRALYQLYHVLNHLNLFGRGYLARAQGLIDGLLEALGKSA